MIKLLNPIMRFEGWEPIEFPKRLPDTRTVEELKGTIEAWSRRLSEVKDVLPELKNMNPKHLGLVADTIELSQKPATFFKDVDMMALDKELNINPLGVLMATFPIISKKNPNAMDFAQKVVDTAGKLMSKFFLKSAAEYDLLIRNGVDQNYKNAIPIVKPLIEESLTTPLGEEFARQEGFVYRVGILIDKDARLEKISLLEDVYKKISYKFSMPFDIIDFVKSDTPVDIINENLKSIDRDLNWCYSFGKLMDINEYLSRAVNDKRIPCYNLSNKKEYCINDSHISRLNYDNPKKD